MERLENYITLESLESAKTVLVPHIFSENYFNILKARIKNQKLSENERYYYNHFIKKKLKGMIELFEITKEVNGREFMKKERLIQAMRLLKKYSRKYRNTKMLISGSFLYSEHYNDIDLFIISKYNKEDCREGKIHINYLSDDEKTLFFNSLSAISVANFSPTKIIKEEFKIEEILQLYELVILLLMQNNDCLQELRELVLKMEYSSNNVVLNSMQLKKATDNLLNSKNPIKLISKYIIAKIIAAYDQLTLKETLNKFIEKNSAPEEGQKMHENWKIYNQTYAEAIEVAA